MKLFKYLPPSLLSWTLDSLITTLYWITLLFLSEHNAWIANPLGAITVLCAIVYAAAVLQDYFHGLETGTCTLQRLAWAFCLPGLCISCLVVLTAGLRRSI